MSYWSYSDNTKNKWVVLEDGAHFISNAVYKLYCHHHVVDPKYGGRDGRIHIARWVLQTNATAQVKTIPFFLPVYENATIANVRRKYQTAEAAISRLEKVKAQYIPYFTEDFPPIPQEYLSFFLVDGLLPPPYTAKETPDPTMK